MKFTFAIIILNVHHHKYPSIYELGKKILTNDYIKFKLYNNNLIYFMLRFLPIILVIIFIHSAMKEILFVMTHSQILV